MPARPRPTLLDLLHATAADSDDDRFRATVLDLAEVLAIHPHALEVLESADWLRGVGTVHVDLRGEDPDHVAGALALLVAARADLVLDVADLTPSYDLAPTTPPFARRLA